MQAHPLSSTAARASQTPPFLPIAEGAGLAHDAGNLLGALGLYCDLLDVPGVLRPEHLHYASELRFLCGRSVELIQRLLDAKLLDARHRGTPVSPPAHAEPATVMRSFEPVLRVIAGADVTLSLSVAEGLPDLPFPGEVLERILLNLVRNAADALEAPDADRGRGQVYLALCSIGRMLRLTVTDNGPGMSPEVAAAFQRSAPAMDHGLGHRVVRELVASTGGVLQVTSNPGYGTSVSVEWTVT